MYIKYISQWVCINFLVLPTARQKVFYIGVFLCACSVLYSTRCVGGAEVAPGVENRVLKMTK